MKEALPLPSYSIQQYSRWARLLPILFFFSYLNFTVFLFAFGPWPWPVENGMKLYTFLAFAHGALLLGYLSCASKTPAKYTGRWGISQLVIIGLIANVLVFFPTAAVRTGSALPDVAGGLADPGSSYSASQDIRGGGGLIVEYIRILLGPFIALLMPLTVMYWKKLSTKVKWLSVLVIVGTIATYIAMGTNKAIADTVLLIPWLLLIGQLSGQLQISRKGKLALVGVSIVSFILFLAFFTATQSTRSGSSSLVGYFPQAGISADYDNFLVRKLPPLGTIGVTALVSYLTQGYYALSLSLDKPFTSMYGAGNSMFLSRNVAKIPGNEDFLDSSYPAKIDNEDGWDMFHLWDSIYPWLASDFSFPGTIIVIFFIGRVLALSWLDSLLGSNPFAVVAFSQLLIMLFYFPANNQCLQSGEGFSSFFVIMALWMFSRTSPA